MFRETKAFSGFSVNDIPAARQFYGEVLGLDARESNDMLELHVAGGNAVLVYPKEDHEPATFTVLNFPVRDIEQAVDELTGKGVSFERYGPDFEQDDKGIAHNAGPKIAWFKDPAGNVLSVMESDEA